MSSKRLLILTFLVLAAATSWYLLSGTEKTKSTLGWDRNFRVEENQIYKIFIARRDTITTTLERNGDHWIFNGTHRARPNAMHNILEAITLLELRYVPSQAEADNAVSELAARGIKVEIFDKKGERLKSYYAGGVTADARGTYMIQDGSEQVMVMGLPNMDGQIRTRYAMVGDDWRDRTVFHYEPEDIQSVHIEYPANRNKSFRLNRTGNTFQVKPFFENQLTIDSPVDPSSVQAFLYSFKRCIAEDFINDQPGRDSIQQLTPFAVVAVTGINGEEKIAAFIPRFRINAADGMRKSDEVERYFVPLNTGDLMLCQQRVFGKIFWAYDAFFQKKTTRRRD